MNYDNYNREERSLCAHLFRLLHENLDQKMNSPLGLFLAKLGLTDISFENVGIYCEVAIIRDKYFNLKHSLDELNSFMDDLTKLIMLQEDVTECKLYSELGIELNNPERTHPKQIWQKAKSKGIYFTDKEIKVYRAMQGMFNAKPDLAITFDNMLLVFEAKFTEPFDDIQLERTRNITQVWSTILYKDFGFTAPPEYRILKIGAGSFSPDINWSDILEIAQKTYKNGDRTLKAMDSAVSLLKTTRWNEMNSK